MDFKFTITKLYFKELWTKIVGTTDEIMLYHHFPLHFAIYIQYMDQGYGYDKKGPQMAFYLIFLSLYFVLKSKSLVTLVSC